MRTNRSTALGILYRVEDEIVNNGITTRTHINNIGSNSYIFEDSTASTSRDIRAWTKFIVREAKEIKEKILPLLDIGAGYTEYNYRIGEDETMKIHNTQSSITPQCMRHGGNLYRWIDNDYSIKFKHTLDYFVVIGHCIYNISGEVVRPQYI